MPLDRCGRSGKAGASASSQETDSVRARYETLRGRGSGNERAMDARASGSSDPPFPSVEGRVFCWPRSTARVLTGVGAAHVTCGFRRWLLGSVAEYLVRHAAAPILLVPPKERVLSATAGGTNEEVT